jgi:hypothetical protein
VYVRGSIIIREGEGCRPLHEGQECSVEDVRVFELVGVLPEEEDTLVDKLKPND